MSGKVVEQQGPSIGDAVLSTEPAPPPTLTVEQMLEDYWQRESDIALMAEEDKGSRSRTSGYDCESRCGSPRKKLLDQRLALHTAAFYFRSVTALRAVLTSNAAQIGHRLDKYYGVLRQKAAPGAAAVSVVDEPTPTFRLLLYTSSSSPEEGGEVQINAEESEAVATQPNTPTLLRPPPQGKKRENHRAYREYPLGLLCRRQETFADFDEMFQVLLEASQKSAIIITDALMVCVTEIMSRSRGIPIRAIDASDGVVAMMMGRIDRLLQANSRAGKAVKTRSFSSSCEPSVWDYVFVPAMWTIHPSIYRPLLRRFLDRDTQAVSSIKTLPERCTLLQAAVTYGNADIVQIVADRCSPTAVMEQESIYSCGGNSVHLALHHACYSTDALAKIAVLSRLCPAAVEMPRRVDGQLPLHTLCGLRVFHQTNPNVDRMPRFGPAEACACLDLLVGLYPRGALVRDKDGKTPFDLLPLTLDSYPRLMLCVDEYLCPPAPPVPPEKPKRELELNTPSLDGSGELDESDELDIEKFVAMLMKEEATLRSGPSSLTTQPSLTTQREIDFGARRVALWLAVVAQTADKQPTLLRRLRRSSCLVQCLLFM